MSAPAATASATAIGGPEYSLHLWAIRRDLRRWYYGLPPAQQARFASQWVTSLAGLAWDWQFDPAKASNSTANWEITELFKKRVATPCNGGKLPDGTQTVTVAGGVYSDEEVNYWLYGVLGEMLGWDAGNILELIVAYRKGSWGGTGVPGRLAWFMAGYQNDMTLPANWSVNLDLITTYHYSSIFGVSVHPVRLLGEESRPVKVLCRLGFYKYPPQWQWVRYWKVSETSQR